MLEEAFEKYVSNYNLENRDIKLKYNHSYRVMKLQEKYAKLLGFSPEDVELARIIGLLHDIGRFEQLRVYNTYNDQKSIDHADYSCVQLFDNNEIQKFTLRKDWYPIIKFAIKNHNKRVLREVKNERAMMHARLIRDTDKIDILFLLGFLKELDVSATDDKVSTRVYNDFMKHKVVGHKCVKNKNDDLVLKYSFVFDAYNNVCLKELEKNYKYFGKIHKNHKQLREIYEETIRYIEERLENERIR